MKRGFDRAVFVLVRQIPAGKVATYGQVAALLGAPRAARAVGGAMKRCPHDVPWQRVVNASGGISLRANVSGMLTQRLRLEQEGIPLARGRVDLAQYRWAGPRRPPGGGSPPQRGLAATHPKRGEKHGDSSGSNKIRSEVPRLARRGPQPG